MPAGQFSKYTCTSVVALEIEVDLLTKMLKDAIKKKQKKTKTKYSYFFLFRYLKKKG